MNQARKIKQLQGKPIGFATLISYPEAPYILIAATKVDLAKLMVEVCKMKPESIEPKKFRKVTVKKATPCT